MQKRGTNMQVAIKDIHQEGVTAAKQAIDNFLTRWKAQTGGNEYGEPMYCGFAWVDVAVTRTNSKEAKALESIGFKPSHRAKTMTLWDPAQHRGQSMDCKEHGAQAYAEVLQKYGINASMGSRAD
jgi:hypothetical protein